MRVKVYFVILLCFFSNFLSAQSIEVLMEDGLRFEKEFKLEEALKKYEALLKTEPDHIQALIHASRMTSNIAGHIKDKDERRIKLLLSENYSRRAIKLNPKSADAHFSLILTLGLQSEIA